MFKVLSVLSALAVLWISAVSCDPCLYQTQLWGGDDPNVFYYCDLALNESASIDCPEGRGFINDSDNLGCVPWEDWSADCVTQVDASTITCENQTFVQPQGVSNPNIFYLCAAQNSTPVELDCPVGRGFYSQNKYLGCYPWALWRQITGCVNAP